ncbi:MAG: single-stranded DNA-binding protein, partial [Hydrogenobacter sp.]
MLNSVMLIGRLVQEPRLRLSLSGIGIAEFTVAYNRRYRSKSG